MLMRGIWKVPSRKLMAAKGDDVKLADGLSGMGNAILDMKDIQARLSDDNEAGQRFCYRRHPGDRNNSPRNGNHDFSLSRTWENVSAEQLQVMGAIFDLFIETPPGTSFNNGSITSHRYRLSSTKTIFFVMSWCPSLVEVRPCNAVVRPLDSLFDEN